MLRKKKNQQCLQADEWEVWAEWECTSFREIKKNSRINLEFFVVSLILFLHSLFDSPHYFCFHFFTMSSMLEKCEKVILQEYLKLSILSDLNSSGTWLIRNKCNFSEERTRTKNSDFFTALCDSGASFYDIVSTSI